MVPPAGLKPATHGLEVRCSIQLSYGGKIWCRVRESNPQDLSVGRF